MAIAFGSIGTARTGVGTTDSAAFTVSGTNPILLVAIHFFSNVTTCTFTYNGVALTEVDRATGGSSESILYKLEAPATGSNTLAMTLGASRNWEYVPIVYTGVVQASAIDASGNTFQTSTASDGTSVLTSTTDNCWHVMRVQVGIVNDTAGAGTVDRSGTGGLRWYDSNGPKTPAGSSTLTVTAGGVSNQRWIVGAMLKPATSSSTAARNLLLGVGI
jgi:hypothetical protein